MSKLIVEKKTVFLKEPEKFFFFAIDFDMSLQIPTILQTLYFKLISMHVNAFMYMVCMCGWVSYF